MKILITGGAGYIGSHTAKIIAQAGLEPVVLDNLSRGRPEAVRWGPLVEADVGDRGMLRKTFRQYPIEAVVHFAAFAYVGESMQAPEVYFRNNFVNTLNLLEVMREEGIGKMVFSSTCATYGNPLQVPIPEDHIQAPVNPYGESKLMVEKLLRWFDVAYGFRSVALRYFNAAGADPEGELGEEHDPETHVIPLAISAALGLSSGLDIYGTDYDTPDGTAIRDYLHVTDLADAHLASIRYLVAGGASTALNLGTGSGCSVREVVAMVDRVTGRRTPVRETARRPGDPPRLIAEATKAANLLGWRPRRSLEEMVRTAWSWKTRARQPLSVVAQAAQESHLEGIAPPQ
jgi:UDP-glucose-4-epimerase GalE